MTTWWLAWWLKRPPLAPCRPASIAAYDPRHRALHDTYAQVFTGCTLAVLEQVERAEALGLPGYRRKRDMPPHLKPTHALRDQPAWVREELHACAYYVSQSGRSFSWLYDVRHVETIREAHVPRYSGTFPAELATKTQLQRAGVSQAVLQTLQPVAEYYRWLDHCWYPLYQRP